MRVKFDPYLIKGIYKLESFIFGKFGILNLIFYQNVFR
jgi:hypothetical protein